MTFTGFSKWEERACTKCVHYHEEFDGDPPASYFCGASCTNPESVPHAKWSRAFPFKKIQPCFEIDFWHSSFAENVKGDDRSYTLAINEWRESLGWEKI